ncbi:MAG: protein YpfM [Pantoea sp. Pent]|nr:protein YpfM [Pantoea sp. Pent]
MRQSAVSANSSFLRLLPIVMRGGNVFTCRKKRRKIATTGREGIMVEHEPGNWKEFIEAMLRKLFVKRKAGHFPTCCYSYRTHQ